MNHKQLLPIIFLLLLSSGIYAQQSIKGSVYDKQTNEPLPGVNIYFAGTQTGTTSDVTGQFILESQQAADSITLSFLGYQSKNVKAEQESNMLIGLEASSTNMQEVIVSASREEQKRSEAPIAISNISSSVISDAKPISIDQVLNKVSGVYMIDLGNEQHSMSIRQPLGYKSLYLYLEDGIPIRTSGLFNHNALIEINMANVRNIEVIRGPASSLYGQEAIGGAVNFITYGPTIVPTAKVSIQGNDIGYKRADFQASNTFNKLGLSIAGYYAERKDGYIEQSDFNKLGLSLRADYRFNDKTILNTNISYIDYYSEMSGGLDSVKYFEKDYEDMNTFTYRDVSALRANARLSHYWNDNSKTSFTAIFRDNSIKQNPSYFIVDDYKPWLGTGDPNLAHGQINDVYFQSYAAIIQHKESFDWKNAALIGGVSTDFSPSGYYANYISIDKSDDGHYTDFTSTDSVLSDYDVDVSNYAAYTQFEFSPLMHLRFVGAIRYDNFVYDYHNLLPPSPTSGAPDSKNTYSQFSPKLGLTYEIKETSGVYVNYSQGFVPPQITELYRQVQVPTLKPSVFYNYEAGGWATLFKNLVYLDASVYLMDGVDEIISVYDLTDGSYHNENAGKTQHKGIEYGLTYTPLKSLYLRVSGTNATHIFIDYVENGVDYNGNDMGNAPGFIANAEIMFKPAMLKGFRIGVETQHLSEYYMDPANTVKYPGFTVFNLRTGYSWSGLEVWVNWMNFTNQYYATIASKTIWGYSYDPGDPSNINIGLSYRFTGKEK
ncbi:MAG: TonB-dependent receptor [Bacteroidetes bacterium]|nr:TonB-dependent receptor [Bacteroidota bacterium]